MNVSVLWDIVSRAKIEDHEAAGRVAFYLAFKDKERCCLYTTAYICMFSAFVHSKIHCKTNLYQLEF